MQLYVIAHPRVGDKGNVSNIVVVTKSSEDYLTLVGR
jgi:hypothetical protein